MERIVRHGGSFLRTAGAAPRFSGRETTRGQRITPLLTVGVARATSAGVVRNTPGLSAGLLLRREQPGVNVVRDGLQPLVGDHLTVDGGHVRDFMAHYVVGGRLILRAVG